MSKLDIEYGKFVFNLVSDSTKDLIILCATVVSLVLLVMFFSRDHDSMRSGESAKETPEMSSGTGEKRSDPEPNPSLSLPKVAIVTALVIGLAVANGSVPF